MGMRKKVILTAVVFIFLSSCATYYKKTKKFHEQFTTGNLEKADQVLANNEEKVKKKNLLLHKLNRGVVKFMLSEYEKSNEFLLEADRIMEDQQKNYSLEALSLLSNPAIKPYKPEDFEKVLVNFYLSMNFLKMGKYNSALVESRRINIKLNELNDKYKDHKNRYQKDAFAHTLMGLIYDANHDYNNAFIAYRNAYDVYESDYAKNFGVDAPKQLKKDLLRAAYRTGFYDEVNYYEKKFGMTYKHKKHDGGEVVFLWLNGLGPVKSEWSINFTVVKGQGGYVTFVNEEYGINIPFYIGDKSSNEKSALENLRMTRIAFPKYLERDPVFKSAEVKFNNSTYQFEEAENVNEIAYKTLRDRMLRELGNALLRFATKKALEKAVSNQSAGLGTLVSVANAVTEKADTRNWQTLPYSISYTRILLPEGENTVEFKAKGHNTYKNQSFRFDIKKGKTIFHTFHTLESYPAEEKD